MKQTNRPYCQHSIFKPGLLNDYVLNTWTNAPLSQSFISSKSLWWTVQFYFATICWGSSIRASGLEKLNKLIKRAGFVLWTALESLELIVERSMLDKLLNITNNPEHPPHSILIKHHWARGRVHPGHQVTSPSQD